MAYQFDFGAVFGYSGQLAQGVGFTLALTAAGALAGGAIGIAGGCLLYTSDAADERG